MQCMCLPELTLFLLFFFFNKIVSFYFFYIKAKDTSFLWFSLVSFFPTKRENNAPFHKRLVLILGKSFFFFLLKICVGVIVIECLKILILSKSKMRTVLTKE